MKFSRYPLAGLVLAGVLFTAHESRAGFDVRMEEPHVADQSDASAESKYYISKGIDPAAPALKVYQENYVPDSVRQKYGQERQEPAAGAAASAPIILTNRPEEMSGVDQNPVSLEPAASEVFPAPVSLVPVETPSMDRPAISDQLVIIPKPEAAHKVESWRARKGENVRDVLRRWSDRENIDLMWASANVPVLQKDYSYFGNFQDAVSGLFNEAGMNDLHSQYRSEGMNPVLMTPASTITTNAAPLADIQQTQPVIGIGTIFKPDTKISGPETRWFGLSGAPLAEVLQVWAEDAGVSLIWQAESNYALKESISQSGHFEDVVYSALSQYDDDAVRPVGEMYKDEATGQKVLVIRTDASAL